MKSPTAMHAFARTPFTRIVIASMTALMTACAGQQAKLSANDRESLASGIKVYAVRHKDQAGFTYESTGYAVAGAIFSPLMVVGAALEGDALRKGFGLEDPAARVRERMVGLLQERLKVASVEVVPEPPTSDEIASVLKKYPGAVVLDVKTLKWGLDNNHAVHQARVRLLKESRTSDILWQATCDFTTDKGKPAPTTEALKADGGKLLKASLLDAADGCADQLEAWITADRK